MLTLTNRIDMRPGAVPLVIHLGQYDSDFSLVFELYSSAGNFTVESGTTAMIRGTKTDGNAYDADATIDVSAKTVTVAGSEQMTAAKGRNVYELVLTKSGKVLSTANFILDVERAAMDADTIASESVLKELNAIIAGAATSTQAAADAASAADRAEDAADSVSSASAQIATNTADISDLKADFEQLEPGLSAEAKAALLACFAHAAWDDTHGQDYYDALEDALYNDFPKITAELSLRGHIVFTSDNLDSLKNYLIVKYFENSSSTGTVLTSSQYSLSGTLVSGTSTINVIYNNLNARVAVPTTAMIVPNTYTRKDYVEHIGGDMAQVTINAVLRVAIGSNLNALSYLVQFYPKPASEQFKNGCIIGGRTSSGNTSDVAVYANNETKSIAVHTHGVDTGWVLTDSFQIEEPSFVSLINRSVSPSVVEINGQTSDVAWVNSNNVNTFINYFCNAVSNDTVQYMGRLFKVGIVKITNVDEETIRYLIPVVRTADNVIGLYDGITGAFYTASTVSYATIGKSNCKYAVGEW